MTLNLTKVAAGCPDIETLAARQAHWWGQGRAGAHTRFMPKRADELIGGSIFWIIGHRLVARQTIVSIAMAETPWGMKCAIELQPGPVPVEPRPCRAHQGWRYLAAEDAPPDLAAGADPGEALPPAMLRELLALGLV
ncbi:hypothetical protein CHU93_15115 [Sandarakinorhabdus cyanobacteriorum]|uniref:DUF1489 domain-containing protein n=1 Tax=Sandarakinorhabdus cyanobacteriorum TaxID=1981098 RepID=A0A255Y696_9SPHN|nr:DUF1489 domain-containing protein [Sandarakinorhabdus cyanobacteriorum]OYQ24691.1 hypothetical protein CHU93_15115 [Sandarakinorhabdus cyanobacteriorum]